jgi:hypothetical protein
MDNYDLRNAQHQVLCAELHMMQLKGNKIYPNQEKIAEQVGNSFASGEVVTTMVVARTQSGKTGSMCAVVRTLTDTTYNRPANLDNVFIVTGLSSIEWKTQTAERIPPSIRNNVMHSNNLQELENTIKDKTDVLIIMDEVHVAAAKTQRVDTLFKTTALNDPEHMREHNIRVLQYSATPNGTLYDIQTWGTAANIILAQPGEGYVGTQQLIQQGRIRQFSGEVGLHTQATQEFIQAVTSFNTPRYHLIRINVLESVKTHKISIKNIFKQKNIHDIHVLSYECSKKTDIKNINKTLEIQPTQHTIIILKNMLRCAKTIHKTYIGVLHDRPVANTHDDVVIQGLTGRITGYDTNQDTIIFTNLKSIHKYEELWENNFDYENENITHTWKTKNTKNTFNQIEKKEKKEEEKEEEESTH